MKHLNLLLIAVIMLTFCVSCIKDDVIEECQEEAISTPYVCTFVQNDSDMDGWIDDTERSIMDDCFQNSLNSKTEIENNLIGEWELVGHGQGWFPQVSQPCGYLTFTADELTFDFNDGHIDTITTHTWELEEVNWPSGPKFKLTISDQIFAMFINQFCFDYMYGDETPVDGNMYLYQKVN